MKTIWNTQQTAIRGIGVEGMELDGFGVQQWARDDEGEDEIDDDDKDEKDEELGIVEVSQNILFAFGMQIVHKHEFI